MIPTIQEIIAGLLNGSYTGKQAEHWIQRHIELAEDAARGDLRDDFASKAMQGFLSSDTPEWHTKDENFPSLASRAFVLADAMLKAREA